MVQHSFSRVWGSRGSRATDFGSGIVHSGGLESGGLEALGQPISDLEPHIPAALESRDLESAALESRGLESGVYSLHGLKSRATDFGSGTAHAWRSRV